MASGLDKLLVKLLAMPIMQLNFSFMMNEAESWHNRII